MYICIFRYCEFLLLLGDVYVTRGNHAPSLHLAHQLARLLHCTDFTDYLAPPTDLPKTTPMTTPTASSLLPNTSDEVCDTSLMFQQRVQTVILTCRVKLLEVDDHMTSVDRILSALEVAHDAVTGQMKSTCSGLQSVKAKGRGPRRGRAAGKVERGESRCVRKIDLVCADVACLRAECHLLLWQPDQAIKLLDESMARMKGVASCEDHMHHSLVTAQLHFWKGKSLAQKINGHHSRLADQEVWLHSHNPLVQQCWAEFRQCYDQCFPVRPAILLREACLWLSFLAESSEDVHHYLTTGQQISLNHITTLTLSTKIE